MLHLDIPEIELYDEDLNEFSSIPRQRLMMEHSLISVSKGESKWKKPFLSDNPMSVAEENDYYRCMTINNDVDSKIYKHMPQRFKEEIRQHISDSMTATIINTIPSNGRASIITSELIYYWMITYNIPFECQKWHLKRLLTLIRVCQVKTSSGKKMTRAEVFERNRALNEARRARYNTSG